ncbi:MAG TPA: hypothetical protein ENK91_02895, partial [Bacteroidetes bacterium]|nr:hypothetical protein [Bacteroidota bacterium]
MITFKNPWEEKGMYYSDWFDTTDSGALHRMGQVSDNDITIEGPFDSKGQSLKFVSRKNSYSYVVTINKMPSKYDLKSIKWAVSYDDNQPEEAYYLFKGGIVEGNKVRVDIQIAKGENSFRVYAYFGALPSLRASVNVFYKKVVIFFISGAGDKEPYLGEGPTNLIEDKVRSEFNKLSLPVDYSSYYLSYKDAYKDEILSKIIPKIPNKEGSLVNIIGHSLGGWNGAHLSQILTDA